MTGNNFRPDIVARIIELIRTGETDLTPTCTAAKPMIPRQQHGLPAMACVSAMQKAIRPGLEREAMEFAVELIHTSKAWSATGSK